MNEKDGAFSQGPLRDHGLRKRIEEQDHEMNFWIVSSLVIREVMDQFFHNVKGLR